MEDDSRESQRRTARRKRTLKKGRIVFNKILSAAAWAAPW